MSIMRCRRHDRCWDSDNHEDCPHCAREGLFDNPSQCAIEGMAQDLSSTCDEMREDLHVGSLILTNRNTQAWGELFREMSRLHDRIDALRDRSQRDDELSEPPSRPTMGVGFRGGKYAA